jgi:hypothetical protein
VQREPSADCSQRPRFPERWLLPRVDFDRGATAGGQGVRGREMDGDCFVWSNAHTQHSTYDPRTSSVSHTLAALARSRPAGRRVFTSMWIDGKTCLPSVPLDKGKQKNTYTE